MAGLGSILPKTPPRVPDVSRYCLQRVHGRMPGGRADPTRILVRIMGHHLQRHPKRSNKRLPIGIRRRGHSSELDLPGLRCNGKGKQCNGCPGMRVPCRHGSISRPYLTTVERRLAMPAVLHSSWCSGLAQASISLDTLTESEEAHCHATTPQEDRRIALPEL